MLGSPEFGVTNPMFKPTRRAQEGSTSEGGTKRAPGKHDSINSLKFNIILIWKPNFAKLDYLTLYLYRALWPHRRREQQRQRHRGHAGVRVGRRRRRWRELGTHASVNPQGSFGLVDWCSVGYGHETYSTTSVLSQVGKRSMWNWTTILSSWRNTPRWCETLTIQSAAKII